MTTRLFHIHRGQSYISALANTQNIAARQILLLAAANVPPVEVGALYRLSYATIYQFYRDILEASEYQHFHVLLARLMHVQANTPPVLNVNELRSRAPEVAEKFLALANAISQLPTGNKMQLRGVLLAGCAGKHKLPKNTPTGIPEAIATLDQSFMRVLMAAVSTGLISASDVATAMLPSQRYYLVLDGVRLAVDLPHGHTVRGMLNGAPIRLPF